jgi:hypothetical protein
VAEQLEEFLTERTRIPHAKLASRALVRAGLISADSGAMATASLTLRDAPAPVRPTILGLVVLSLVTLGGGLAIQGTAPRARTLPGDRPLELVPARAGALRVLATPWAHLQIDGEYVDTTPFARAIPLSAGEHHLMFTHPNAPPERRAVTIVPGETLLVEVNMAVAGAPPPPPAAVDAGAKPPAGKPEKKGAAP